MIEFIVNVGRVSHKRMTLIKPADSFRLRIFNSSKNGYQRWSKIHIGCKLPKSFIIYLSLKSHDDSRSLSSVLGHTPNFIAHVELTYSLADAHTVVSNGEPSRGRSPIPSTCTLGCSRDEGSADAEPPRWTI